MSSRSVFGNRWFHFLLQLQCGLLLQQQCRHRLRGLPCRVIQQQRLQQLHFLLCRVLHIFERFQQLFRLRPRLLCWQQRLHLLHSLFCRLLLQCLLTDGLHPLPARYLFEHRSHRQLQCVLIGDVFSGCVDRVLELPRGLLCQQ